MPLGDARSSGRWLGLSSPSGGDCRLRTGGRGTRRASGRRRPRGWRRARRGRWRRRGGRSRGRRWSGRRGGCRRRSRRRQRHGDGRSVERVGLRARGDRCVEGHCEATDWKRRGAHPRPGVRVAAREGERHRGAPELGPNCGRVPHRVRRVVVDTEGEHRRRRAAARADVAVGKDRCSACGRRRDRHGAREQHGAKDPKRPRGARPPNRSPPSRELGVGHGVSQCVGLSKGGIIALLGVRGNPVPLPDRVDRCAWSTTARLRQSPMRSATSSAVARSSVRT